MKWNKINESKKPIRYGNVSEKLAEDVRNLFQDYLDQVLYGDPSVIPLRRKDLLSAMKRLEASFGNAD